MHSPTTLEDSGAPGQYTGVLTTHGSCRMAPLELLTAVGTGRGIQGPAEQAPCPHDPAPAARRV